MTELKRLALPGTVLTGLLGLDVLFRPIPFGFAYRAWLVALGGLTAAALVPASAAPYRRVPVEAVGFLTSRPVPPLPAGARGGGWVPPRVAASEAGALYPRVPSP